MRGSARIVFRSPTHPDFEQEAAAIVRAQIATKAAAVGRDAAGRGKLASGHGLGDVVYRIAHPIGCWLDRRTAKLGGRLAWAKTGLCGCSACSRRRRWLNGLVAHVRRWEGGWQVACTRVATALLRGCLTLIDRMF